MKYGNPSREIWKGMKMSVPKKGYGTMWAMRGGKKIKVRTAMKWSTTDAMGLKAFKEGTSMKKLKSVW